MLKRRRRVQRVRPRRKNRSILLNLVGLWCLERLLLDVLAAAPFLCSETDLLISPRDTTVQRAAEGFFPPIANVSCFFLMRGNVHAWFYVPLVLALGKKWNKTKALSSLSGQLLDILSNSNQELFQLHLVLYLEIKLSINFNYTTAILQLLDPFFKCSAVSKVVNLKKSGWSFSNWTVWFWGAALL